MRLITFGEDSLTGEFRVSDSGTIALPLIGTVRASGLSPDTLATRVSEALLHANLLRSPSVSAEVITYRPIFMLGEVSKPGQYPYQPGHDRSNGGGGGGRLHLSGDPRPMLRWCGPRTVAPLRDSKPADLDPAGRRHHGVRAQILKFHLVVVFLATMLVAAVGQQAGPAPGPLHIIGGPTTGGCIAGAVSLPPEGPGFQTIHLDRSAFWGAPHTIAHLEQLGREATAAGLPTPADRGYFAGTRRTDAGRPCQSSDRSRRRCRIGYAAEVSP